MKEDFLHYVWKFKLFDTINLKTTDNEVVQIIKSGLHNFDGGPDFFNATIIIGSTKWVGNVEIHLKSSDWNRHHHQIDKAYDNVILHVVYEHDKDIFNSNNQKLPTIELKSLIKKDLINNYNTLLISKSWIPCQNQIKNIDKLTIKLWLERLAYERLERKSVEIKGNLSQSINDWESIFYQTMLKHFGLKINSLPFEMLAKNTPLVLFEKHKSILSIEALLFGQAGFLDEKIDDEYFYQLKKEYLFLKNKFNLNSLDKSNWKFLRLRPNNFSTIRLAQIAQLFYSNTRLFNKIINAGSLNDIKEVFNIQAGLYWQNHYNFGKISSKKQNKTIGTQTINNLLINVIAPVVFVYGKEKNDEIIISKAIKWLEDLKPEKNSIISKWEELSIFPENSLQSQGVLELKNNYCSEKKCLNCNIGNKILTLSDK